MNSITPVTAGLFEYNYFPVEVKLNNSLMNYSCVYMSSLGDKDFTFAYVFSKPIVSQEAFESIVDQIAATVEEEVVVDGRRFMEVDPETSTPRDILIHDVVHAHFKYPKFDKPTVYLDIENT